MTGYLFRPADADTPRPTILAPCGMDSTAEAGYVATGYMALPTGLQLLRLRGARPGRHALRAPPSPSGPTSRCRSPRPSPGCSPRTASTPHAVIVMGRSFGGYLGPRAAARSSRGSPPSSPTPASTTSLLAHRASSPSVLGVDASRRHFLSRLLAADEELDARLQDRAQRAAQRRVVRRADGRNGRRDRRRLPPQAAGVHAGAASPPTSAARRCSPRARGTSPRRASCCSST